MFVNFNWNKVLHSTIFTNLSIMNFLTGSLCQSDKQSFMFSCIHVNKLPIHCTLSFVVIICRPDSYVHLIVVTKIVQKFLTFQCFSFLFKLFKHFNNLPFLETEIKYQHIIPHAFKTVNCSPTFHCVCSLLYVKSC